MEESIIIKQTNIIDGYSDPRIGDVKIENGKIKMIEPHLPEHAHQIISGKNLALMPGIIDPHVHFREPGGTHKETIKTGSRAAAKGGVTSFFDMPNTFPAADSIERIEEKKAIAKEQSLINYNFFIAASNTNIDELKQVENIPGIKIFMGSSTGNLLVDDPDILNRIFSETRGVIAIHSEDESIINKNSKILANDSVHSHYAIRSEEAAITCTNRAIELAKKFQRRLHICHLTTAQECDILRDIRMTHPYITTEVTPQHLLLSAPTIYDKLKCFAQVNPPIRGESHRQALWKALKDDIIQCIATDHAPHTIEEKMQPYGQAPSGMPGVETSLPLMLTLASEGFCSLNDIVRWCCTRPAMIYDILQKGTLMAGYDADLVLVDLEKSYTLTNNDIESKCKWTPFNDRPLKGKVEMTLVNGQIAYREGSFMDNCKGKEILVG